MAVHELATNLEDLVALAQRFAGAGEGAVAIPATWLETVAVRSAAPVS